MFEDVLRNSYLNAFAIIFTNIEQLVIIRFSTKYCFVSMKYKRHISNVVDLYKLVSRFTYKVHEN